jgi:hypothetical protein
VQWLLDPGMAFGMIPERFPQSQSTLDITMASKTSHTKGRISLPARRLSMRTIKEVLRFRCELKLGYQQIGKLRDRREHGPKYLKRAEGGGASRVS